MRVILGSASEGRQKLMRELGFKFEVMISDLDERSIRHENPRTLTGMLARAKMNALLARCHREKIREGVLITADQVVVSGNQILEKPLTPAEAWRMLEQYGPERSALCVNGLAVQNLGLGLREERNSEAEVFWDKIPSLVINRLIATKSVFKWAGAFRHDDPMLAPYVRRIKGDVTDVVGLPKLLLFDLLRQVGAAEAIPKKS
jgi:septum formation protein